MSWQEIVRQLHALYQMGSRPDEAERLNKRLQKAIGKSYDELPASLIATCVNA